MRVEIMSYGTGPSYSQSYGASKVNYVIPALALICWFGAVVSAITLGGVESHNYQFPSNQYNPKIKEQLIHATTGFCYAAAATVPAAAGATVVRSLYNGCANIGDGVASAGTSLCGALKDSVTRIGKPEGIIINTLAAPFVALYGAFVVLANTTK